MFSVDIYNIVFDIQGLILMIDSFAVDTKAASRLSHRYSTID